MEQMKKKEDYKINKNLEEDEIRKALRDIDQFKNGGRKDNTHHGSKSQVRPPVQNLTNGPPSGDQNQTGQQKSYLDKYQKNIEFVAKAAEDKERLRMKREILEDKQDKLNRGLHVDNIAGRGRSLEPKKQALTTAGSNIINTSTTNDGAYSSSIKNSQNKIAKLVKDRERTMNELKNNPIMDEIDNLQYEVDNGYSTDLDRYRNNVRSYADNLRNDKTMDLHERAQRLDNVRAGIDSFRANKDVNKSVNYRKAKPMLNRRIDQLNNIIQNEQNRTVNEERRRMLENMNIKVPNYKHQPGNSINDVERSHRNHGAKPLIHNYNRNNKRLNSGHKTVDRVNHSHQMPDKSDLIPDSRNFMPDVGHFKQNIDRAGDLEVEERAIMNMYAQDFDDLKVLNMLSKNSDLYNHKLKQYQNMSNSRLQAEKLLQKQRMDKIKRHFRREQYEEERKLEEEKWLEEQQKNLISKKIHDRINKPPTPEYVPPPPVPKPVIPQRPAKRSPVYNPNTGIGFHIDYIAGIEKGTCNQIKAAYAIFSKGEMVVGNKHMGPVLVVPDANSATQEKANFALQHAVKLIDPDKNANLIIEVQVPDKRDPNKFVALGWTLLNLFTFDEIKLNTGIFKLPLYDIPTNPNLSVNDILTTLSPLNPYMWMRISIIGDDISELSPDMHPTEYIIPKIHQRVREAGDMPAPFPEAHPTIQEEEVIKRDPFFSNNGLQIYMHYLRNYLPKKKVNVSLRCSVVFGRDIVKDENDMYMTWATNNVKSEQNLFNTEHNRDRVSKIVSLDELNPNDAVLPFEQTTTWFRDLYNMLWDNQLKEDLMLSIEVIENNGFRPVGITSLKLNNEDGSLRYGSFDLAMYTYPLKDFKDPTQNEELGYRVSFFLNEAKNLVADRTERRLPAEEAFKEEEKAPPEEEEKKQEQPMPQQPFQRPEAVGDESEPFIPNILKQHEDKNFDKNEVIVLNVDYARFLPENNTLSRVVVRGINQNGTAVINQIEGKSLIEHSSSQNPLYGMRTEISKQFNPNLDPSTTLIFRLDTIDKYTGTQRITGYAFFPLFLNMASGEQAKSQETEYSLHTGNYQLPIFNQKPHTRPPVNYNRLTDLERIPCASLLIRVNEAPRDGDGKLLLYDEVPVEKHQETGILEPIPTYHEGNYNSKYIEAQPNEPQIYSEKGRRPDPELGIVVQNLKKVFDGDKKFAKKVKRATGKKYPDITDQEFIEQVFLDLRTPCEDMLDMIYFSQYIPTIGFRFSLDLILNPDPKLLYVGICSINPPGSLYQEEKKYEKIIVFNEIDFESRVKAPRFVETLFGFVNVPENLGTHMIIDIKSIKFTKGKATEVTDYGYTVFPIFAKRNTDEDAKTDEYFIRSGSFMIPMMQGKVRNDVIEHLTTIDDPWAYLLEEAKRKPAPINIMKS